MKKIPKLKRLLWVTAIIFITVYLFYPLYLVGSYPYAQEYKFDVPVEVLYNRVEKFKTDNVEYNPPKRTNLVDSFDKAGFSHIWLYYEDKNTLVHLFIKGGRKSIINFDALNSLSDGFQWKKINHDLDRKDNLAAKREFRQRFLDKLNLEYKDNGNNAFVFWK